MKIILEGHDYKYAAEQMLLTLFPQERPEYAGVDQSGNTMTVSLRKKGREWSSCCLLELKNATARGEDVALIPEAAGKLQEDRIGQRLVKNAIYRAALASGIPRPAWGSLTGVRPGKVLSRILETEPDREKAEKRLIREYDVSPLRARLCMDAEEYTRRAADSLEERDVCLYVGIPFCPTRCAYCSFVSQSVERNMKLIEPFLEALYQEIRAVALRVRNCGLRPVSVYFGGGTPTTLSSSQLHCVFSELEDQFDLSSVREFTVEAGRPDTITMEKLHVLSQHGVTRVSVNPQTMSDRILEVIGRRHTAEDILKALQMVRAAGSFQVNMDLIAGLPDDSVSGFSDTLDKVLSLEPENITVHTLSLKNGSRLRTEGIQIPAGEEVSQMLDLSGERLRKSEYAPYYLYRQKFMSGGFENVGWTRKECENLYNICIMEELCGILAMGGGGSTKLVKPGDARNLRIMAPKYPQEYIASISRTCAEKETIEKYYSTEE